MVMRGYYSTNGGQHIFCLMADEKPTGYSGPYVVIDPDDWGAVERLRSDLINSGWIPDSDADALDDILAHFAAPRPPKPDEPQGQWAVVMDADGNVWTRMNDVHWSSEASPNNRQTWGEIAVVRVLSVGVES